LRAMCTDDRDRVSSEAPTAVQSDAPTMAQPEGDALTAVQAHAVPLGDAPTELGGGQERTPTRSFRGSRVSRRSSFQTPVIESVTSSGVAEWVRS
jgi:hypothetical protein